MYLMSGGGVVVEIKENYLSGRCREKLKNHWIKPLTSFVLYQFLVRWLAAANLQRLRYFASTRASRFRCAGGGQETEGARERAQREREDRSESAERLDQSEKCRERRKEETEDLAEEQRRGEQDEHVGGSFRILNACFCSSFSWN